MKKSIFTIFAILFISLFISCTSEDIEDSVELQDTETVATGGEDRQTPAGE